MKQISVLGNSKKPSKGLNLKAALRNIVFTGLVMSSVSVIAQTAAPANQGPAAFTLKVITHGEGVNRSDNFSEPTRQDNRRADVSIKTQVPAGTRTVNDEVVDQVRVKVSEASNRSIRLNDGGVIWVSKDPASLTPVLNVTAPRTVSMEGGELVNPINFAITTNYDYFIDSWELEVYHSDDQQQKHPLKTFTGSSLKGGGSAQWDGISDSGKRLNEGDKLSYVLKVRDKDGHLDRTHSREIALVGPQRNITDTSVHLSNLENNLELQTIPVSGSRVRIFGRDIPTSNSVAIDGDNISLVESKFVTEKLLPEGQHSFDVAITDSQKNTYNKSLNVDLKSQYMFMVGLADVTVGEGSVTGNLETLSDGDKYLDGDIFVDGRLAFYLKGKVKGKYLITAQMDTGTADIEELFDDIHKKDAESLFRRLDPDQYYPVYGDDSTIIDDTDSQGKIYVRVDWDKSRALWGNYNTAITGTELSSFNRSLYGAKFDHRSTKTTTDGDHRTALTVFGSEAQTAFRHNEFLGTGGSLYYLNDTDIVDGSEKIWIEVREDRDSDRVIERVELEEGRDYQIDDFQGRIILNRPLLQIAEQSYPSLIKDEPLDGDQVYLMVDYEYVPDDFDSDKASYGGRGKVWLNDHIAVGGTYVHEDRAGDDYELRGVDLTFKKSKGTYIKAEYAESESNQASSFTSLDGGLNFDEFTSNTDDANDGSDGAAYSIEARVDLTDISSLTGSVGAWFKTRDADFSTASLDTGNDTTDIGVEAVVKINDRIGIAARATELEREDVDRETTGSLQADVKVSDKITLAAEVKYVEEKDLSVGGTNDGEGILGAFKVGFDVTNEINLYAIAQTTIESEGNYEDNDLVTLGAKAKVSSKLDLNAEVSSGDRGDSALVGANYRVTDTYSLYTNFTHSTDTTADRQEALTIGQRKGISDQLSVYTEHQFTHDDDESGVGHTFGLDYRVSKELTATFSAQSARLDGDIGLTDRDAFTVGLSYKEDNIDASTRLEYRFDDSATEETEQWVTTNRVNYRVNPSLRLQAKLNYSETNDQNGNTLDARFVEAGVGFAYRPINHDRHNILGRITYLYDLQPLNQDVTDTDERSLIASLENSYQINQRWEVGGKLAHRTSEIRAGRGTGDWESNDATLAAARVRYHMTENWDALAQYHWLMSDETEQVQHGAMISVDRHIGKNLKVGVGYNFTDFNDDLGDQDGTSEGWFVNLVGKY